MCFYTNKIEDINMIFEEIRHRGTMEGTKLGIDVSFPISKSNAQSVAFDIWVDEERVLMSKYVSNGRGSTIGELTFFPSFSKEKFQQKDKVELLDELEKTISLFYFGTIKYLTNTLSKNNIKLDALEIKSIEKINYIFYSISKKLEIDFIGTTNLKTIKGAKESVENLLVAIERIINHNRYETLELSPHQIKFYSSYNTPFFEGKGICIDAVSYYNGQFHQSLDELTELMDRKANEAKQAGSNLLMNLAQGEIGSKEFDSKIEN